MRTLSRVLLTAAGLLLGSAVVADAGQAAPKPPANDDCLACHGDPAAARANGTLVAVAGPVFEASKHGPMACVDCHADLAALTEFPHPDTLKKVNCASCHDAAQDTYTRGIHAQARRNGGMLAATCVDCHGKHDIKATADPTSRTNHQNLAGTCATCHGNQDIIDRGHIEIGNVAAKYHDSIHGKAIEKSGLAVAPSCVNCHGSHDIKRRTDATSQVFRANIPATCGTCHSGIQQRYDVGVHGVAMKKGDARAPVCADCHSAHAIKRTDTDTWRLGVTAECGTCHAESMRTFRDTFHGQVTGLGFVRVAVCADCHGAHDIFPKADARSTVSPARLVATCGRCHSGATASFVRYDPHADRHDKARNPTLYVAAQFMDWLLLGVFAFFGLHTALWLQRAVRARREVPR